MEIEQHPLEPFLPGNARLLMLGSFPPQRKRWSMEFYYPNWNNDSGVLQVFYSSMTKTILPINPKKLSARSVSSIS